MRKTSGLLKFIELIFAYLCKIYQIYESKNVLFLTQLKLLEKFSITTPGDYTKPAKTKEELRPCPTLRVSLKELIKLMMLRRRR
jgi:hypothetical protein